MIPTATKHRNNNKRSLQTQRSPQMFSVIWIKVDHFGEIGIVISQQVRMIFLKNNSSFFNINSASGLDANDEDDFYADVLKASPIPPKSNPVAVKEVPADDELDDDDIIDLSLDKHDESIRENGVSSCSLNSC